MSDYLGHRANYTREVQQMNAGGWVGAGHVASLVAGELQGN